MVADPVALTIVGSKWILLGYSIYHLKLVTDRAFLAAAASKLRKPSQSMFIVTAS